MSQPQGWTTARLGEILPLAYGKSLPASKRLVEGKVPVFGSNGIVGFHSEPLTRGPVLVIGRKGAAGLVHFSPSPCWPIDTAYFAEGAKGLNLKFFLYLLHHVRLGSLDQSTAIPSLGRDSYSAIAPTAEQQRIVAKLEELFSDLDATVAALERARANLKRYRAAVLKAAVEGKLTEEWRKQHPPAEPAEKLLERILAERRRKWEEAQLAKYVAKGQVPPKEWKEKYPEPAKPDTKVLRELPEGWCWVALEQLVCRSEYGTSVKCDYGARHEPVLRIPNISGGTVDVTDLKRSGVPLGLDDESCLRPGDVLVCRTNGSISLVGQTAVIIQNFASPHGFASYLLRLRFLDELDLPRWVDAYLRSPLGRAFIERNAASSAGQHNISLSLLHRMPIPFPPLAEMRDANVGVSRAMSLLDSTERESSSASIRVEALRQAILKHAFEGRLIPQDPNDEPAGVLLERIRAGRADAGRDPTPPGQGTKRRKSLKVIR